MMPTMKELIARGAWADWWKPNEPMQPHEPSVIDADTVVAYLKDNMRRQIGARVDWRVIYEGYADWWADLPGSPKCLSAAEFGAALAFVCEGAAIRVQKSRGRVFCLDVRLIDPGVRALSGPADMSAK